MKKSVKVGLYIAITLALALTVILLVKTMTKDYSENLSLSCKEVLSPECQEYLIIITKDKKFEEAINIQGVRIWENEKLLNSTKVKIQDKKWLDMTAADIDKKFAELQAQAPPRTLNKDGNPIFEQFEKDYSWILDNNETLRDIIMDILVVSTIQRKELKDKEGALNTLKQGQKILDQNKYCEQYDEYAALINRNIEKANNL